MFTPDVRCVVVVGAQWGDEGKGKVVDALAERAQLVVPIFLLRALSASSSL